MIKILFLLTNLFIISTTIVLIATPSEQNKNANSIIPNKETKTKKTDNNTNNANNTIIKQSIKKIPNPTIAENLPSQNKKIQSPNSTITKKTIDSTKASKIKKQDNNKKDDIMSIYADNKMIVNIKKKTIDLLGNVKIFFNNNNKIQSEHIIIKYSDSKDNKIDSIEIPIKFLYSNEKIELFGETGNYNNQTKEILINHKLQSRKFNLFVQQKDQTTKTKISSKAIKIKLNKSLYAEYIEFLNEIVVENEKFDASAQYGKYNYNTDQILVSNNVIIKIDNKVISGNKGSLDLNTNDAYIIGSAEKNAEIIFYDEEESNDKSKTNSLTSKPDNNSKQEQNVSENKEEYLDDNTQKDKLNSKNKLNHSTIIKQNDQKNIQNDEQKIKNSEIINKKNGSDTKKPQNKK